jgi:hypothetical protein
MKKSINDHGSLKNWKWAIENRNLEIWEMSLISLSLYPESEVLHGLDFLLTKTVVFRKI